MKDKVLIVGGAEKGVSALMIATLKEKYGNDIIVVTAAEAQEQGLNESDFANTPRFKITAPPILKEASLIGFKNDGKANRRERRKKERRKK